VRRPLTKERVIAAAVKCADADGIDALSMRKLATRLGYEVMSLYNHVANKDEILDEILDDVVAKIELPSLGAKWKPALRATAVSAHRVLGEHPWAVALWWRSNLKPARLTLMDSMLRCLRDGGFTTAAACRSFHAVMLHFVGFTAQQIDVGSNADDLSEFAGDFLRQLPVDRYPHFAEHVQHHIDDDTGGDFEFVLDLILDGLERSQRRR
jgi:AcrR family transcriptional regulator